MIKKHIFFGILFLVGVFFAPACVDELSTPGDTIEEGLSATLSLKLDLPEMSVATRADMEPGTDTKVNSLWVGIFSARSGKCTYAKLYPNYNNLNFEHGSFVTLPDIETESGASYIVAVGNPVSNYGYKYNRNGLESQRNLLTEWLPETTDDAINFTWQDYQDIAVEELRPGDIQAPVGNLIMSGTYSYTLTDFKNDGWEDANYITVAIKPGENYTLPGAVHLRREISQINFKIKRAQGKYKKTGRQGEFNIVYLKPVSYRVYNVPHIAWLHEKKSKQVDTNAGDMIKVAGKSYESGDVPLKANYYKSALFNGQEFTGNQDDGFNFDFWMVENKRHALADGPITYEEREVEFKEDDSVPRQNKLGHQYQNNTGIYKALSGQPETMNNAATFVEIKCTLIYTDDAVKDLNDSDPERIEGVEGFRDVYYRKADAIYTIHLGGINDNWNDFAHRRNHKYTYNLTVIDLENILVEAVQDNEQQPGAEGIVSDVINPAFEMDAHYGVCNIQLSNYERTTSTRGNMSFRIQAFYDDERFIIDSDNVHLFNEEKMGRRSKKLWNWVEFRPTTGENVLAPYKPYTGEQSDGKTFRLNEINDIVNHPGANGSTDSDNKDQQWYTVFINEYVYEDEEDESGSTNWVSYVNQEPRSCWIQITGSTSQDQESIYMKSKYMITQRSIQTFYDMTGERDASINAIGLEHINETYGLNLRWDNVATNTFSTENGRMNMINYLTDIKGINWNTYINQISLQKIENININAVQYTNNYGAGLEEGKIYYVTSSVTSNNMKDDLNWDYKQKHNVNNSRYIRIMEACMNRNRDLNGNGTIDIDEMRWYLPASSEMIDIVLGRNSLETPLMDFVHNPSLNSPKGTTGNQEYNHHANTRFHYATSNRRVLWAEEGSTINEEMETGTDWRLPPWEVRCARALSTDLTSRKEQEISPAYTVDWVTFENPRIYPTYYEEKNMRNSTSVAIPAHQETSTLNRLSYNGFEFRREIIPGETWGWTQRGIGLNYHWVWEGPGSNTAEKNPGAAPGQHDYPINHGNELCEARFGTGWRLPTMKEGALIKLAMGKEGIYAKNEGEPTTAPQKYDIIVDNFLCSTYREYGSRDESRTDKTGIFTGILYWNGETGYTNTMDKDAEGNLIGRIACITNTQHFFRIRCVRDL